MDYGDTFGDGFGWSGLADPAAAFNPAYGAGIGAAIGTGTAIAVRQFATDVKYKKHAEGIGLAANLLASGAAMFFGPTRGAGWSSLAAGIGGQLPRYLEDVLINYAEEGGATYGVGLPVLERVGRMAGSRGVGMPVLERNRRAGLGASQGRLLNAAPAGGGAPRLVGNLAGHFGASIAR